VGGATHDRNRIARDTEKGRGREDLDATSVMGLTPQTKTDTGKSLTRRGWRTTALKNNRRPVVQRGEWDRRNMTNGTASKRTEQPGCEPPKKRPPDSAPW